MSLLHRINCIICAETKNDNRVLDAELVQFRRHIRKHSYEEKLQTCRKHGLVSNGIFPSKPYLDQTIIDLSIIPGEPLQ